MLFPVWFHSSDMMRGVVVCASDEDLHITSLSDSNDRSPQPRHIAWDDVGQSVLADRRQAELRIAGENYCLSRQDAQILASHRP